MSKTERRYGSVPPSRRRLFAVLSMVLGAIVVVAGLVINWVTGTSVQWGWLAVAAGFVVGIYAFYLWVRLSG